MKKALLGGGVDVRAPTFREALAGPVDFFCPGMLWRGQQQDPGAHTLRTDRATRSMGDEFVESGREPVDRRRPLARRATDIQHQWPLRAGAGPAALQRRQRDRLVAPCRQAGQGRRKVDATLGPWQDRIDESGGSTAQRGDVAVGIAGDAHQDAVEQARNGRHLSARLGRARHDKTGTTRSS